MKTFSFAILLLTCFLCLSTFGQETIEKEYYKSYIKGSRTDASRAKYIQMNYKNSEGWTKCEVRNKAMNEVVFQFRYSDSEFEAIPQYDVESESLVDSTIKGNFTPPVFSLNNNDFRLHIQKKIMYPYDAQEDGIAGKVVVQFVIDEHGKLHDACISQSAHPSLDREIMRLIKNSPSWTPAQLNNEAVKIMIEMPFTFKLL